MHIVGLDKNQENEFTAIFEHGDERAMTKFLAYFKPRLVEIDTYLEESRKQFINNLGKSLSNASEIEKIAAANRVLLSDQPAPYNFNLLTKSQIRTLLEINPQQRSLLNHELIEKLGAEEFLENFESLEQLSRERAIVLHVPNNDNRRALLELLAKSGIVRRGRKIPLRERLSVLQLQQLNDMAKELKLEQTFKTREHATQTLSEIPGAAILLAMIYTIDDLFLIDPNILDTKAINKELSVYASYAKLLCATRVATRTQATVKQRV